MDGKGLSWQDAIVKILKGADGAMHYKDIADSIVERKLRKTVGATPANTVSMVITTDINKNGEKALFERVNPGEYLLKGNSREANQRHQDESESSSVKLATAEDEVGIIQAFGMYWRREFINWRNPKLYGQQTIGAKSVDFSSQIGVYLLHDGRDVVYVGRSIDRPLGKRLSEHTRDRLNGRWDRFSWFGLLSVTGGGKLAQSGTNMDAEVLITTLESLLIEALEPPQNRRGGDGFRAIEYLQVEDQSLQRKRQESMLKQLLDGLNA